MFQISVKIMRLLVASYTRVKKGACERMVTRYNMQIALNRGSAHTNVWKRSVAQCSGAQTCNRARVHNFLRAATITYDITEMVDRAMGEYA